MSQTFIFLDGKWIEGNQPIIAPRTHAFWLGAFLIGVTRQRVIRLLRADGKEACEVEGYHGQANSRARDAAKAVLSSCA
jgi:branched-subunit amino acid aminotransferase/4-amino-4-deoxychorismate lyase